MAYRVLEVTLLSAKDLKSVNLITRMEVYAVATISGDPITRQCTPPDPYGGRHPTWNATLRFAVPPTAAAASGCLHILLRTARSLGDRDVGEVIVPLSEVLAGACPRDLGPRPPQFASYQVRKVHRTETRGVLHLSYRLGAVLAPQVPQPQGRATDEPVVAYPVPRPFHPQPYAYLPPALLPPPPPSPRASAHMAMPPPSPQASCHMPIPPPSPHDMPPPPPKAYGHLSMPPSPSLQASGRMATPPSPPPPKASGNVSVPPPTPPKASGHLSMPPASPSPGAGYVAAPQPPKTAGYEDYSPWTAKNMGNADFGMGLSAGLVGGAIGGMMAGDMVSDAAAYNAGYRAGLAADWGKAVY